MTHKTSTWRNRIVGSGMEAPDQFLANPQNWRIHPRGQQDAMEGVLDQVGWVQDVIVNRTTGNLVDGHMRVKIALRRNEPEVPVKYVELTEAEENLILATLDPIAAAAVTDAEQLSALLADVRSDSAAIDTMLSELANDAGLVYGDEPPEETADVDEMIDRAEQLREKWGVESGMMFGLGKQTTCPKCGKVHKLD